jgi:hypothetical protein
LPEAENKGQLWLTIALSYAQALPTWPKIGISVVIELLAMMLIWQLWQRPVDVERVKKSDDAQAPIATNNIQRDIVGSSSIGSAASSGQTGGITAGNYYQAPPATDQQKVEQLARLASEIQELKDFPRRPMATSLPTSVERMHVNNTASRLYAILSSYYKVSIEAVPIIGKRLRAFQKNYYDYQEKQIEVENEALREIRQLPNMQGKVTAYFVMIWRYSILRSSGMAEDEIRKSQAGVFEPFSAGGKDAEEVWHELSMTDNLRAFNKNEEGYKLLGEEAAALVGDFKMPN